MMMKNIFFFILLSMSWQVLAEEKIAAPAVKSVDQELIEVKKSNYQLNARYKGGPYLIYDCEGEYYACVDKDGSDRCREKREENITKKLPRYVCAPLKKFDDKKTCLEKNYEVLESMALKRFCFPKN